ncbi:unnamed protein product [Brugia timori]|uniref:Uncharacterized protein n=1 Tax=Brugia timori TaxID=42155 RepID=A0A0R3QC18_9BILA|nr:unnamed protein product [Brugia timori]
MSQLAINYYVEVNKHNFLKTSSFIFNIYFVKLNIVGVIAKNCSLFSLRILASLLHYRYRYRAIIITTNNIIFWLAVTKKVSHAYVCAPARSGFHLYFLFDFHFFLFIVFKNLFQSAKTSYDLSPTTTPTYLYLFWLFGDGV